MRVFMLGWEFPPFISGGLGTACYGLTKAMDQLDIKVTFLLPRVVDDRFTTHVDLLCPDSVSSQEFLTSTIETEQFKNITFKTVNSFITPYDTEQTYQQRVERYLRSRSSFATQSANDQSPDIDIDIKDSAGADYSGDMYNEIHRYAMVAVSLAKKQDFDVIHAHDWMTFPAAVAAAKATGKPLIVQVHSTEFDRSGEHVNQMIYDIERMGMHMADKIIAVSYLTRNIIISRYGIKGEKVEVVHNGVEQNTRNLIDWNTYDSTIEKNEKIVLFMGRITMQKGPEYFLGAAKKVLEVMDNVKFVMAGSGDMMHRTIELAAELGIGSKVLFTGFLRGDDVKKIYRMADLFVMPSVSEPFGLVPLEALENDVPVIISKQSGVSEVLTHALKVDFWDTEEMANKIIAVLRYPPLRITLQSHGNFEVRRLRWTESAEKCLKVYNETLVAV